METKTRTSFQKTVWHYYQTHGRDLPWRHSELGGSFDPYKILVSEVMLQQTQVSRVIPKYHAFLQALPTVEHLAQAPLAEVLRLWLGLGYNRRAKYLHDAAQNIVASGRFPTSRSDLVALPGIGINTAAAIVAYAYNQPVVFIETNIRTVYIHHFFTNDDTVSDSQLLPLVETTVDITRPREWYWALMDYGAFLKTNFSNPSRQSKHYVTQSTFQGSKRQLRGAVLKLLTESPKSDSLLMAALADERLPLVLATLQKEGLIHQRGQTYHLGK